MDLGVFKYTDELRSKIGVDCEYTYYGEIDLMNPTWRFLIVYEILDDQYINGCNAYSVRNCDVDFMNPLILDSSVFGDIRVKAMWSFALEEYIVNNNIVSDLLQLVYSNGKYVCKDKSLHYVRLF